MTTLGGLIASINKAAGITPAQPLDIPALVASVITTGAPGVDLGSPAQLTASMLAWTDQDDDAHEPCSLTACRAPLHPGPCKGWKGILHAVSPGTFHQLEAERVKKANARRVKRIEDLRAQGKPIPRRLLTEIKPKPAPGHPAHAVQPVPLSQVNQKADLAAGQAHHAGQAISNAAGVKPNTPQLPLGPKQKKPTVAGRGPAFVITQPKVTDTYKLDKAAKITPQEWAGLSDHDKTTIRNELTAIKARGFGPQQKKADDLLAKLPAPTAAGSQPTAPGMTIKQAKANGLLAQSAAHVAAQAKANGHTPVVKPASAPGKVSLGQAVKTPTANAPGGASHGRLQAAPTGPMSAADRAKAAQDPAAKLSPAARTFVYNRMSKADFDSLDDAAKKQVTDDLDTQIGKGSDASKKQAEQLKARFGITGKSDGSGPSAPPTPAAPASSPPSPSVLPAHAQAARAVAARTFGGAPTSKKHLTAYGQLSKADFDLLDAKTQKTIRDDLANAKAKFLDPKKKQEAADLLNRFGSSHPAPASTPNAPSGAKGYSDPMNEAVKAASSGTVGTDDTLKAIGRLTPDQVGQLTPADRKTVSARLDFIAAHPKATAVQRGRADAYRRNISSPPPAGKLDHVPSLAELHADEQKAGSSKGALAIESALKAATSTSDRADRVKTLAALTKAQFDSLTSDQQRQITDALHDLHRIKSTTLGSVAQLDPDVEKAFDTYTGLNPGVHRLKQAEADFRAGKVGTKRYDGFHKELLAARTQARGPATDALKKEEQRIAEDNPGLPGWLRAEMVAHNYNAPGGAYHAIQQASNPFNYDAAPRLSSTDMSSIFRPTADDLAKAHPIHAQAVKQLRENVISTGLAPGSPWSSSTKDQLVQNLLQIGSAPSDLQVPDDRVKEFNGLPTMAQVRVRRVLQARLTNQTNVHAKSGTYIVLRQIDPGLGGSLTGDKLAAVRQAADGFATPGDMDIYRKLSPDQFDDLPNYVQSAIKENLDTIDRRLTRGPATATFTPQDNALKMFPMALAAHLDGSRPTISDRRARNATDVANYGIGHIAPESRVEVYRNLPLTPYQQLPQADQAKIKNDLTSIVEDTAQPLGTRYAAAITRDLTHGHAHNSINVDQVVAMGSVNPIDDPGDRNVVAALNRLDKADYDKLDPIYREAVDARLAKMASGPTPGPAQALTAKFHPAAPQTNTPGGYTPTAQASVPPHVQAALDTIYGVHASGKSHTMAHQLSTYGALRGHDFALLNGQEQGHLLGDLSFIATTAKGPSADKARKLIDRFTPAGTPSGQVPTGAIVPPVNALPGQTRYATPLKGLAKAKDSGTSGDGWYMQGGQRVWGKYGAAGLLLQHTDPQTGEKRYLMVQRGPAISDPGKWTFPGGASDSKETPHQGAARETIEELGLKDDAFKDAQVHGDFTYSIPGSNWKYTSVAASVPTMIKPDLSTAHARAETSDAKWLTEAEIKALDAKGELHHPIAGGKLHQNVISLFPQGSGVTLGQTVRPGPVTKRQGRLHMPAGGRQAPGSANAWTAPHKPSKGKDLIPDKAASDAQRQRIKQDRKLYDGKTADGRLAAIGAQQGFDDTPTVVSKSEIDRLLATGDYIEVWRGVSGAGGHNWRGGKSNGKTAAQINEEMRSGPAYYGKGIFGNGYYLATQKRVAQQYADGTKGSIARMLIPKSAVTKKYDEVKTEAFKYPATSKAKGGNGWENSTFHDPGRYAAAKGIDGIEIEPHHRSPGGGAGHVAAPGKPAFNWLNRSVLIMQKEPG